MQLSGIFDFHVHTAPDVVKRKFTDIQLGQRLVNKGFGGVVLKNHYFETASRASLLQELFPMLEVYGGIALNHSAGGLNAFAVEQSARLGGKVVWFPTMDAAAYRRTKFNVNDHSGGISLLDQRGKLTSDVEEILEVAKEYDLVVSTGHISVEEGLKVIRRGSKIGLEKLVVTHADNCNTSYSIEEQKEAVQAGAVIEHSYFTVFYHHTSIEEIAQQIRYVGIENVLLDSDFGQPSSSYPDEGMQDFLQDLSNCGFSELELNLPVITTPRRLLGIDS